ncbi:MAG TPA: hypothetical protein PKD09_11575 [Aggregatilinea sp.]|uniref:hypothetical protein n=1 Tax=Aggregatilinea sp. TaxID=2806333 RepID=UPI002D1584A2|nr:hypothetical protein [Aggregatilinea sp.]HML22280.1 hypothetical protein [Aggregatilinea sp.]
MDHLNLSQVRIMQIVHDTPGIRADTILDQLDLDPNQGAEFMLDLERYGLLSLNRSTPNVAPTVTLGAQGQRLAFQIKATQLVTITELFSKLPENDQLTAVTMLEQVAAQQAD